MKSLRAIIAQFRRRRAGGATRSGLLRRTFVVAFILVSGGLLSSGGLELWFRYQESIAVIGELQQEMARGAAFKIRQFVRDIEKTMQAAGHTPENITGGITPAFEFQLHKLLKVSRAISTVTVIDPQGRKRMKASRVVLTEEKAPADHSGDEAFRRALEGKTYFGPVYFVRQSEPTMRIAVPMEWFAGQVEGVLLAEVNLKYIWEVISRIQVGRTGYAYVVSRDGDLVAHPDISLVLQKRNLGDLAQVQAALQGEPAPRSARPNVVGRPVFAAYASIPELGWRVLVERSAKEAYAPLYGSLGRHLALVLIGLGVALLASLLITLRVVRPVRTLREGADRIGAGELEHRIQVRTGDELEALADGFNRMTERLQESYAGLERKVEARTHELAESLEQQTAISDILRVISSSPTELQPVFDAILDNSCGLCSAELGVLMLYEGGKFHIVAERGISEQFLAWRRTHGLPHEGATLGEMVRQPRTFHVLDARDDEAYRSGQPLRVAFVDMEGARTFLQVPMVRHGELVGVINIHRREVRAFSDQQVALVETFADQAVIAIANANLFEQLQARTDELSRSVSELQALHQVGRAVSSTLDLDQVLSTVVGRAITLSGGSGGVIYEFEEEGQVFRLRAAQGVEDVLMEEHQRTPIPLGESALGTAATTRAPVQVPDLGETPSLVVSEIRRAMLDAGFRALLAVPLLLETRIIGGLGVWRREPGGFSQATVNVLEAFAAQSALAIQNARLFREIEERSTELEVASRHKSQFLANMSHELRTPLNAILGYTELVLDDIYGTVPGKVREVMERVEVSGRHLLGLINDVLDLSKIEAGQLQLTLGQYSMQEVVQNVLVAVESLAEEKSLELRVDVPGELPMGQGDEQRLTQVLLNLAGNAIKFTEAGAVGLRVAADNGSFLVSVSDTGPGIPPGQEENIFSEFHQADGSSTKQKGGTGLGLAIARRFVEMHGGRIWVESRPDEGATFTFSVPIRAEGPRR